MRVFAALIGAFMVLIGAGTPALASLHDDIIACAAIHEDAERLACFDAVAKAAKTTSAALNQAAADALKREFRFEPDLMTGPFTFFLPVSGDLKISRSTAAAREVERIVRRINKALSANADWGVRVTVHGAHTSFSRGNPYTGAELLAQAQTGMERTGLTKDRYQVILGKDANPILWDDGRVRSVNEHIIVEVVELGAPLTR